jgi:hypothetical protein
MPKSKAPGGRGFGFHTKIPTGSPILGGGQKHALDSSGNGRSFPASSLAAEGGATDVASAGAAQAQTQARNHQQGNSKIPPVAGMEPNTPSNDSLGLRESVLADECVPGLLDFGMTIRFGK